MAAASEQWQTTELQGLPELEGNFQLRYWMLTPATPGAPAGTAAAAEPIARAVLLIHGLGLTATNFDQPEMRGLLRFGTVVIPDLVGCGGSAAPRGDAHYTMQAQASVVLQLLGRLRIADEILLVGHSMGGPIALAVAESCAAAAVAAAAENGGSTLPRVRCVLYSEPNVDGGDCFGSRLAMKDGVDLSTVEDPAKAAKAATCRHLVAESDSGELLGRMQAVRAGANAGSSGGSGGSGTAAGVPSLVLVGEKNRGQLTSEAALLAAGFPVKWIAGSGHSQHVDNPADFYAAAAELFDAAVAS